MVFYIVVVGDDSEEFKASQAALQHVYPGRDKVLLVTIIPVPTADPNAIDVSFIEARQQKLEEEAKQKMRITGNQFVSTGVECSLVVIVNDHPGQAICKLAVDHHADAVIVGSREQSVFQKMLGTTIAKYLTDHAECNVVVIKRAYTSRISAPHPVAGEVHSTRIPTLRSVDELTTRLTQAQTQAKERAASSPKIGSVSSKASDKTGWTKLEVELQDELHRVQFQYRALMERIQQLEEEEIARVAREKEKQIAAELAQKRAEEKEELDKVISLEEEERQRRLQEEVGATQEQQERVRNIKEVNRLEDEEKARRIAIWKEQAASLEQRHQALEYTRSLEERERHDRILTRREEETEEEFRLREERRKHLAELAVLEEEERVRRVREKEEEDKQVMQLRRTESLEDLAITKKLEEQERQRRIAEEGGDRDKESKEDLQVAKQLEEAERERRIKEQQQIR